jgi:hypothetical protein
VQSEVVLHLVGASSQMLVPAQKAMVATFRFCLVLERYWEVAKF